MSKPQLLILLKIDHDLDHAITVHIRSLKWQKKQERKVELPGVEPRAFGLPCAYSATATALTSNHHPILSLCILLKAFSVEQPQVEACFTVCFMHCIYCVLILLKARLLHINYITSNDSIHLGNSLT